MTKNKYQIAYCAIIPIILITSFVNTFPQTTTSKNPIIIQSGKDEYSLDKHISILIDKSKKLDIKDVSSDSLSKKFIKIDTESPNFGFDGSVYWVRFRVMGDINTSRQNEN